MKAREHAGDPDAVIWSFRTRLIGALLFAVFFLVNCLQFLVWLCDSSRLPVESARPQETLEAAALYSLSAFVVFVVATAVGFKRAPLVQGPEPALIFVEHSATTLLALAVMGLAFVLRTTGATYEGFVSSGNQLQLFISLRYAAFVSTGMFLGRNGRISKLQWFLIAALSAFNLVTQTKATVIDLFWSIIVPAAVMGGRRGLMALIVATPLTFMLLSQQSGVRAERQGTDSISIFEEYEFFVPSIIVECVDRFDSGHGEFTIGSRMLTLLVPSPLRPILGITVSVAEPNGQERAGSQLFAYYDVGSAALPTYGGGFSSIGELYLNFGWGALAAIAVAGYGLARLWAGFFQMKHRASLWYGCAPAVTSAFLGSFRNDVPVHTKMAIQSIVFAVVLEFVLFALFRARGSDGSVAPRSVLEGG